MTFRAIMRLDRGVSGAALLAGEVGVGVVGALLVVVDDDGGAVVPPPDVVAVGLGLSVVPFEVAGLVMLVGAAGLAPRTVPWPHAAVDPSDAHSVRLYRCAPSREGSCKIWVLLACSTG